MFGKVELEGDSKVQVDGILRLHGSDHVMTLTLPLQTKGNSLSVRTHFVIPYVEWGLNNPSTFLLHVGDRAEVDVTAVGRVLERERHP
jgi:hypothetical protein